MAVDVSTNDIRDLSEDWSIDIREGKPYSGESVQKFIKKQFGLSFDITKYHSGSTYSGLTVALSDVPEEFRSGGMSVRFVDSNVTKYVTFFNTNPEWSTNENDWVGSDNKTKPNSNNYITSGGLYEELYDETEHEPTLITVSGTIEGTPSSNPNWRGNVDIPSGVTITNNGIPIIVVEETNVSTKVSQGAVVTIPHAIKRVRGWNSIGEFSFSYTLESTKNIASKIKDIESEINGMKESGSTQEFITGEKTSELSISHNTENKSTSLVASDALYKELYINSDDEQEVFTVSGTIEDDGSAYPYWENVIDLPSGITVTNNSSFELSLRSGRTSSDANTKVKPGDTVVIEHIVTRVRGINTNGGDFSFSYTLPLTKNTAKRLSEIENKVEAFEAFVDDADLKPFKERKADTFSSGDEIVLEQNSIANFKTYRIHVSKVNTMGTLKMCHGDGTSQYYSGYVEINNTKIIIQRYRNSALTPVEYQHGLTISNTLDFSLTVDESADKARIELSSNGNVFTQDNVDWTVSRGVVKLVNSNCSMNDVVFSYGTTHYNKDILIVGASYLGHTSQSRWPYYMVQHNYKNYILNNFPGAKVTDGINDVNVLLTHFRPKAIFWCYGMNNVDSETEINSTWKTAYDSIKSLCEEKHIELILMTFPTARGGAVEDTDISTKRINKWKNQLVRNSGLRYVDIDKAVGANETTGEWYAGMLGDDGVHPTQSGAITMYNAVIATIPELAAE